MAVFLVSRYCFVFGLLFFYMNSLAANPISSFSLRKFDKNPNFDPEITLFGDAKIVNGGHSVEINRASISSAGRLMYRNPIRFVEGNPRKAMSFSTYFSFSISPENGDGFAFVFLPSGFPLDAFDGHSFGLSPGLKKKGSKALVIEFDTKMDSELGDPNGNHVGIDVGSLVSVRVSNVSDINLVLNSGDKLNLWISYDANSKHLEVRLSELGSMKPKDPLISCPIDLLEMWKDEEVFVGISSSSGNSTQSTSVYSWSFWLRHVPSWLHSEPLDPIAYTEHKKPLSERPRNVCLSRILTVLIFATGCGALALFIVLFMKAMFATRHTTVVPVEYPVHPEEFGYKKIKVVVKKATNDEKQ